MTDASEITDAILGQRQQARRSALQAQAENPEQASRAIELGKSTGVPSEAIYGDVEGFEQNHRAALTNELVRNNPHLIDYVNSHPLAAKVSADDFHNLDSVSQSLQKLGYDGDKAYADLKRRGPSIVGAAIKGFQEHYGDQPYGQWMFEHESTRQFIETNPITASYAKLAGFPIEFSSRLFSGAIGALQEGGTEAAKQFGMNPAEAQRLFRDIAAEVEYGLMSPEGINALEVAHVARAWLEAGKEPPVGLHPEIDKLKGEQAKLDAKNLDEALRESSASATRERSPEFFANFVRQHTDAKIEIPAEEVRKLYGEKEPSPEDGVLGWAPEIGEQLRSAEQFGGDVEIPLKDWLANVKPEVADALHDHIRHRPGGLTLDEAKLIDTKAPEQAKLKLVRGEGDIEGVEPSEAGPTTRFNILDENEKPLSALSVTEEKEGKHLYVNWLGPDGLSDKPIMNAKNQFGPAAMMDLMKQLQKEFPEAESIGGFRATGARGKTGAEEYIEIPLRRAVSSIRDAARLHPMFPDALAGAFPLEIPFRPQKVWGMEGPIDITPMGSTTTRRALLATEIDPVRGPLSAFFKQIRNRIVETAGDTPVHVVTDADFATLRAGNSGAYYHIEGNQIVIPESSFYHEEGPKILLHESIHAATSQKLARGIGVRSIRAIMEEVKAQVPIGTWHSYGFYNAHEFLAEALSNRYFQNLLKKTKLSEELAKDLNIVGWRKKTQWDGIVAFIAKLLGVGSEHVSGLEAALAVTDTLAGIRLRPEGAKDVGQVVRAEEPKAERVWKTTPQEEASKILKHYKGYLWDALKSIDSHPFWDREEGIRRAADIKNAIIEQASPAEIDKTLKLEQDFKQREGMSYSQYNSAMFGSKMSHPYGLTDWAEWFQQQQGKLGQGPRMLGAEVPKPKMVSAEKPKESEPPRPKDTVRFYHGGTNPTSGGGRWVATTAEYARNFRAGDTPNEVHYVDIPKGDPTEIAARAWDELDEKGQTNAVGTYRNIELPEEWAKKLRPLEAGAEVSEEPKPPVGERPLFKKPGDIGMTVAQQRRYQELMAKQAASDDALIKKATLAWEQRHQSQEWKDNARLMEGEVRRDLHARPDIAADRAFREGILGDAKIKRPKLDPDRLSEEQKAALPEDYVSKRGGMNPDDIASVFGYQTGEQLINRLAQLERQRKEWELGPKEHLNRLVDEEVERRMQAQYGDLGENILEIAQDHAVSQTQLDSLHEDVVRIGTAAGVELPIDKATMKAGAKQLLGELKVGQASLEKMLRLAGRAGELAERALLEEDPTEAYKHKQHQFTLMLMAAEAKKFEKAQKQFDRTAKQFAKRQVSGVDQEYTNHVRDILSRVGRLPARLISDLGRTLDQQGQSLEEFVTHKEQFGLREVPVWSQLFDPSFKKAYESLSVDEFNAIHNSIKALVKNGRDELKITKAGEEADLDVIRQQMVEQLREFKEKHYDAEGKRWLMGIIPPGPATAIRTYLASHLQLESLFNRWDRGDRRGVFTQYVMRDLVSAANYEAKLEKTYAKRIKALEDKVDLDERIPNSIFINPFTMEGPEELQAPIAMTRKNLRAVLQNVGNKSNLDKLARGYGIEPEEIMKWLDQHATKEDWNWAQAQGDIFKSIKAESDRMYRRISGIAPPEVEIEPLQTRHGTYEGWYHPVSYHPLWEGKSKKLLGGDALEGEGFYRATTPAGYTKARTGYAAPIDLSLDMTPVRMRQMLHDIAFREAVINASKIMYDKDIRSAIAQHYGVEYRELLIPYLKDVANSSNFRSDAAAIGGKWSEFFRQNIIGTLIGFNPGTVLKHGPTALINSITEVGPLNFLSAVKSLVEINEETGDRNWTFAINTSEELQRRTRNYHETLKGASVDVLGKTSWRDMLLKAAATPVALSDLLSAVPTWLAGYRKAMKEGAEHGDAIYDANTAVRRAHGSSAITSRPAIMRGNPWLASLYGFWSHITNRQYEMMWRAKDIIQGDKSLPGKVGALTPVVAVGLFSYVLWPAIIEELVSPEPGEEKHGWAGKWGKAITRTASSSLIGIRDVAYGMLQGRDPAVGLISQTFKTGTDLARDMSKSEFGLDKQRAGKTVRDGITAFGAATGLANAQEGKLAEYLLNYYLGKERPKGPWEATVGARFGTTKGHSKSLEEYLQSLKGKK